MENIYDREIVQEVKKYLNKSGLTQRVLARRLGIGTDRFCRILQLKTKIKPEEVTLIKEYLNGTGLVSVSLPS